MKTSVKVILAVLVALAIMLASFAGGMLTATLIGPNAAGASSIDADLGLGKSADPHTGIPQMGAASSDSSFDGLVNQVKGYLSSEALVAPTETSLTASTIEGMLKSVDDKYAQYFDPKHYQFFNEQTQGSFGGIGITLGENKQGQAYVVSVIKGTPAARAGVKNGDIFVAIDKVTRPKWTSDEVVKRVRGKEGTKVTLQLRRTGQAKPLTFTLTREQIAMPNVMSELKNGNVGYIRMYMFNAKSAQDTKDAIAQLKKKGAKGYILDLRDNPGGLLQAGVDVVSLFVKDGVAVRVDERGKPEQRYFVTGDKVTDAPVVVLVNGNSASASEIAAGALQDYGRATLVGVKSFGKGSVQTIHQLANGGAVKFTTAHYLTPKKRVIDKKGLVPDVIIPMDEAKQADAKTDVQMQQAIEVLQGKVGK